MSDSGAGAGRREVAWRLFAAEYDDAWYSYSQSDEERAPNYVVTPTGARVNRLFVVGVLTEVEPVSDEVLRARVVDPTGPFVVYAGQYQPEPLAFLERAEPPTFVAVTGKARTFQPDDADVVYTSVRPETINEVDAATRDRWVVSTAEQTLDRVSTFAAALDRVERGDDLEDALLADGVDIGLAAGIPRAIEQYETTPAYLDAVRETALDAVRVVAGERDEVASLDLEPGKGGDADLDASFSILDDGVSVVSDEGESAADATPASTDEAGGADEADEAEPASADDGTVEEPAAEEPAADEATEEAASADETGAEPAGDAEPVDAEPTDGEGDESAAAAVAAEVGDEMYEMDDEERERIESEYDTDFSTGAELTEDDAETGEEPEFGIEDGETESEDDEPESEIAESEPETTEPETEPASDDETAESGSETDAEDTGEDEEPDTGEEAEPDAAEEVEESEPAEPADLGADELEDVVVEYMQDLDDGDGAAEDELVAAVVEDYGVAEEEVREAIQGALMAGRCFEPDDAHVKPI